MLAIMRKHARNWLMKIILGIIILVFIFYFGSIGGDLEQDPIATVGGTVITREAYINEYQNLIGLYRQRYGANLTEEVLAALDPKRRAYDSLVNQAVILAKADELNLDVSDQEVQTVIYSHPAFQRNGNFDLGLYEQTLRHRGMNPGDFEALQRKMLKIEKLERLIKESVKVSETEARELYLLQNQEMDISFVRIDPETLEGRLTPSPDDLESYLADNAERFRVPKKIRLQYLAFPGADFADGVSVTDTMIEDYYYGNLHQFRKPQEEPAEPYIPLEEVRHRIVEELRKARGLDEAYRQAKAAHDTIYQTEDFEEYAAGHDLTVKTTEFFSESTIPEELVMVRDLIRWSFEQDIGETSPVLSDDGAYYLLRPVDQQPSYVPTLAEARDAVERHWRADESLRLARSKAENLLQRLRADEGSFEDVLRAEGFIPRETGFFIPGQEIPGIGYSGELFESLLELSAKNPLSDKVFFIGGIYHVIMLREKGSIDETRWEEEKEHIRDAYMSVKKDQYFRSWLEETKASMAAAGKMVFHRAVDEL